MPVSLALKLAAVVAAKKATLYIVAWVSLYARASVSLQLERIAFRNAYLQQAEKANINFEFAVF